MKEGFKDNSGAAQNTGEIIEAGNAHFIQKRISAKE